jgi:hypothetical protein
MILVFWIQLAPSWPSRDHFMGQHVCPENHLLSSPQCRIAICPVFEILEVHLQRLLPAPISQLCSAVGMADGILLKHGLLCSSAHFYEEESGTEYLPRDECLRVLMLHNHMEMRLEQIAECFHCTLRQAQHIYHIGIAMPLPGAESLPALDRGPGRPGRSNAHRSSATKAVGRRAQEVLAKFSQACTVRRSPLPTHSQRTTVIRWTTLVIMTMTLLRQIQAIEDGAQ